MSSSDLQKPPFSQWLHCVHPGKHGCNSMCWSACASLMGVLTPPNLMDCVCVCVCVCVCMCVCVCGLCRRTALRDTKLAVAIQKMALLIVRYVTLTSISLSGERRCVPSAFSSALRVQTYGLTVIPRLGSLTAQPLRLRFAKTRP